MELFEYVIDTVSISIQFEIHKKKKQKKTIGRQKASNLWLLLFAWIQQFIHFCYKMFTWIFFLMCNKKELVWPFLLSRGPIC